jgi:hypothetical protein
MTERKNRDGDRAAIDRFFDRELMPIAAEMKATGTALLDIAPEPQKASYYRTRAPQLRIVALEWGGADSIDDLESQLVRMWQHAESPAFVRLAPAIAKLAQRLRSSEDQPDHVSEFVYVMY